MNFLNEWLMWVTLALGIALFSAGFKPMLKVAALHFPVPAIQEALAS